MIAWRIAKEKFALDRTGYGASINGQRWNSAGIPAIYAGLTPAIAGMEKLVHTGDSLPTDLVLIQLDLPDDKDLYQTMRAQDLPAGWNELPSSTQAAAIGDAFLQANKQLGLIVPSAVIPEESNIVINPNHPAFAQVTLEIVRPFRFDQRLER